jgi:heterodisulfide reductase subunit B
MRKALSLGPYHRRTEITKRKEMRFAIFIGCNIPARLKHYELSSRAVLEKLGVTLCDYKAFTCCGYPLRNSDSKAFLFSAAGNIALAERDGLDILALCKCCFGSLKEAQHRLSLDEGLKAEINEMLKETGLRYEGRTKVKHLLSVLKHEIGLDAVRESCRRRYNGLKIATHYGCHALRPSRTTQFDNPVAPTLFDELVEATGATSVPWTEKLNCCGAPVVGVNDNLSMQLTTRKIKSAKAAEADFLCTACPYCQIQFDHLQKRMLGEGDPPLPSVLYTQLLGLGMGIDAQALGLSQNQIDISRLGSFLAEE